MISVMDKPNRSRTSKPLPVRTPVINIRLGQEREAAVAAFIAAQKVPPDKTAVILKALEVFLEQEGFWPLADDAPKG